MTLTRGRFLFLTKNLFLILHVVFFALTARRTSEAPSPVGIGSPSSASSEFAPVFLHRLVFSSPGDGSEFNIYQEMTRRGLIFFWFSLSDNSGLGLVENGLV